MSSLDSSPKEGNHNAQLLFEFFRLGLESIHTSEASFLEYDITTGERKRTITTSQVVDCVVIALWGKSVRGKDVVALVHKASPNSVKELIQKHKLKFSGNPSYMIISGPFSPRSSIDDTRRECVELFGDETTRESIPKLSFIKSDYRNDSTSVAIRGRVGQSPEILVVEPNYGP